jgi:trehalose 6-phosphate synthase
MRISNDKPLVVIVSNRGPFSFKRKDDGSFDSVRGQGGLVTALAGLMAHYEVLWVAAALSDDDRAWAIAHNDQPQNIDGTLLQLVRTDPERYDQYYNVIANPLLWFAQHQLWDTPRKPDVDRSVWDAWREGYIAINRQMADAVAETLKDIKRPVIIFPQDYQLYMVPHFLRKALGFGVQIQPFVHIPWPGPDAWRLLPSEMREALLRSMLASDRVGFQTRRDAFNFVQCCRFYLPDAHSYGSRDTIEYHGRSIKASAYPISIDVEKVEAIAEEPQTRLLKARLLNYSGDSKVILRVDRIEPSKNILRGLQAFRALLENHPEHQGKVNMLMLLVPSRMEVDEYQSYLQEVMAEAGMINAEYSDAFWEPVRIIVGDNYHRAIAAFQFYDILLVNPIADGMNLVAKEGALVNQHDGVILLSEHAGAFYELGDHALVVSPFDIYSTSEAMHRALTMPVEERHRRAEALRNQVKGAGVKEWFTTQLADALRALNSQERKDSTSETPQTRKSDASRTDSGVSSESTPRAKA